jgi:hypothetical protein
LRLHVPPSGSKHLRSNIFDAMQRIIPPVAKKFLEQELTRVTFLRKANRGGNFLYTFSGREASSLMREVGRLREESFRGAGGGTGREVDIDSYDTSEAPYEQLIVWDPTERQVLGGYRFKICDGDTVDAEGKVRLSTAELFRFSDNFKRAYIPYMIELGRAFVRPSHQATRHSHKGLHVLDNLWDGLAAIAAGNPDKRYFFGKVTMYQQYNVEARNCLLYFLEKHFADTEALLAPVRPLETHMDREALHRIFNQRTIEDDYRILSRSVRRLGEVVPSLIRSYMRLSPTMKVFGTAINPHCGDVEETALMVTIRDIHPAAMTRHALP